MSQTKNVFEDENWVHIGGVIWQHQSGIFTFSDETENFIGISYNSYEEAENAAIEYGKQL